MRILKLRECKCSLPARSIRYVSYHFSKVQGGTVAHTLLPTANKTHPLKPIHIEIMEICEKNLLF